MSTTLRLVRQNPAASDTEQPDSAEFDMRRALGLLPPNPKTIQQRRNPVPIGSRSRNPGPPVNRVAEAEAALAAERQAGKETERRLREVEAIVEKANIKLGQMELARDQALAALALEHRTREAAEAQLRDLTTASADEKASTPETAPTAKKRGRPPGAKPQSTTPDTDQAVEWWIPGWKTRVMA